MIKLFRKIRKNPLPENKFSKYLIYAVGEIILVVIGILISLWINNTSQNQKNKETSKVYLNDFKRDLIADTTLLEERIKYNKTILQSIDSIFFMLNTNTELSSKDI